MTPTRSLLAASLVAAALSAAAARPAFAGPEYEATSFTGGYTEPPTKATAYTTQIGPGQDDATKTVTLPFEFPFFGRIQTKVSVCSNGWLAFGDTTAAGSANAALPDAAAPNGIVAALWDDLATGTGAVKTFTTGVAPDRVFVVAWHHVDTFSAVTDDDLSFQVRLHETTGVIEIAFSGAGTWNGLSYTSGIEDPTGAVAFGAGSTGDSNTAQPTLDWRFTPRAIAVTGTLLRDRPVAGKTGLGATTETGLPVAGIDLELVRDDGVAAARGRTGDDGTFSVTVLGGAAPATLALHVVASGAECRVVDAAAAPHRFSLVTGLAPDVPTDVGTLTLGAAADATNPAIRKAVNVQQAAHRGFAWARDAAAFAVEGTSPAVAAETIPSLDFRFVPGVGAPIGRSGYVPASATLAAVAHVHDATDNPDPWDDDVVLRECGHHVLAAISAHPAALATRSWEQSTSTPFAWSEGFAHWFACVVQGRSTFIDTKTATTATVLDLEAATPAPKKAPDVTGAVACSLWDLVDDANESSDEFAGTAAGHASTAQEVFRAIDLGMDAVPTGAGYDVAAFFDAWRSAGPVADRAATARIFIHHGATADDAREPNDRAGEESSITATPRVDGLVLSKFNEDRYAFDFAPVAPGAPAVLAVAVKLSAAAAIEVEVLDAADARIAFATNAASAQQTLVTATSADPVPAGSYKVRVAWISGAVATYTLSHFSPLAVATTALDEATKGDVYKRDLAAAGGVPPYTFTTTLAAPGLAVVPGGTRILGTPAAEGDYTVSVSVTDAAGVGSTASAVLTLHVNAALGMRPIVGVAAEEPASVAVGTGGTHATWTPVTTADGALSLAGGSTLTLSGDGGAARSFVAQATAVDDYGRFPRPTAASSEPDAPPLVGSATVVVCPKLPADGSLPAAAGGHFGYWFDSVAGGRADLRFRFAGTGRRPTFAGLIDAEGTAVDLSAPGRVVVSGSTVRLAGVRIPRTGRYYVVFARTEDRPFAGALTGVAGRVKPPADVHGVVVIDPASAVVPVSFDVLAGSRLRVQARAEQIPRHVVPEIQGLLDPNGADVQIPGIRQLRGGPGVQTDPIGPLALSGEYTLRLAGDRQRTGPIFWRVRFAPPRRRGVDVF